MPLSGIVVQSLKDKKYFTKLCDAAETKSLMRGGEKTEKRVSLCRVMSAAKAVCPFSLLVL